MDSSISPKKKQTLLELWLENYCMIHIQANLTMKENDTITHKLISDLIIMGSDNDVQYQRSLHQKEKTFHHEELCNAVMVQIRPGWCEMLYRKYDK